MHQPAVAEGQDTEASPAPAPKLEVASAPQHGAVVQIFCRRFGQILTVELLSEFLAGRNVLPNSSVVDPDAPNEAYFAVA